MTDAILVIQLLNSLILFLVFYSASRNPTKLLIWLDFMRFTLRPLPDFLSGPNPWRILAKFLLIVLKGIIVLAFNPWIAKARYNCTESYKFNYNLKTINDKDLRILDISN